MARAYTAELRDRALRVCAQGGLSRASLAALFGVGESTLYRWQQAWAAGGEAACRGSSASPGREGLGHAQGTRGRAQRPDVGRVRAGTRQACRGEGEPAYLVPGAQEAGSAAQKRACARRSRTGPSSPRRGTTGGPSWLRWTPSASSSLTRAGSTPGWPGLTPVPLQVSAPWARCRGDIGSG
jgi:transposase-like protein